MSTVALFCENLFLALGIKAEIVYDDAALAMEKVKNGQIAAAARGAQPPLQGFENVRPEDNLHFVPIDQASLPNTSFDAVRAAYLPARLKPAHYPAMIPPGENVPTIATSVVLAVYGWPPTSERFQRVSTFVNLFFDNIDKFAKAPRHPGWADVNLAAEVPGWIRFGPAKEWLDRKRQGAPENTGSIPPNEQMKKDFVAFTERVYQDQGLWSATERGGDIRLMDAVSGMVGTAETLDGANSNNAPSRHLIALKQKCRVPFCFHQNGSGSNITGVPDARHIGTWGGRMKHLIGVSAVLIAALNSPGVASERIAPDKLTRSSPTNVRVAQGSSVELPATRASGVSGTPISISLKSPISGVRFIKIGDFPEQLQLSRGFRLRGSWITSVHDLENLELITPPGLVKTISSTSCISGTIKPRLWRNAHCLWNSTRETARSATRHDQTADPCRLRRPSKRRPSKTKHRPRERDCRRSRRSIASSAAQHSCGTATSLRRVSYMRTLP